MKNSNKSSIGNVIRQLIDDYQLRDKLLQTNLSHVWGQVMGEVVARRTLDITIRSNMLIVRLSSAPLKNDLQFEREKIRQRMNEGLGGEYIEEVRIL